MGSDALACRIGAGLSTSQSAWEAATEAARAARGGAGGPDAVDLAFLFLSRAHLDEVEAAAEAVREELAPRHLLGCVAEGVVATPLRTVPAGQAARYNRGDEDEPTQYLSLHPLGPLAELIRHADLRNEEQVRTVQTRTWALDVPLEDLPEIRFDNADQFGITAEELVADDRSACQQLAAQWRGRVPGLVVPSAALPATRNVVLFGPGVAAPYLTEAGSPLDIPASITAEHGRPLVSLLDIVRFVDGPHPALGAWQQGTDFSFVEPERTFTREQPN